MKIITGKVGTGKTLEMIKQAHIKRFTIVVRKEWLTEAIRETAHNLGYIIPDPISYSEFLSSGLGMDTGNKYFIENIEEFLAYAFPQKSIKGFICDGENVTVMEKLSEGFFKRELI